MPFYKSKIILMTRLKGKKLVIKALIKKKLHLTARLLNVGMNLFKRLFYRISMYLSVQA